MSDLVFKLVLRTVDQATAPIKALVAQATGGNAKVVASIAKATAAAQKFKVAETVAAVSAKQLSQAAEGIRKGVQPADAFGRALMVAKEVGGGLRGVLERIGSSSSLRKQGHDAEALGRHAGHANHQLHAMLRSLVEMAELGPMGHLLAHATPWIGAAAIGFAGVAAARGVYELGKGTGERGADVGKRSQKVGLGNRVEDYQRLVYAAGQFEVEQDALDTGLERFSKFAYGTQLSKKGGNASKALKDIGIKARDSHGKLLPILDVLPKIADRFQQMADGPRKTALALTLFSRSGANLIPMLNKGGAAIRQAMKDADDFGIVLGKEDVERSEEFIRAQKRMGGAVMGLKLQLGTTLLGPLTRLTQGLTGYIKAHRPEIVKAFGNVVDSVAKRMPALLKAVSKVDWGQFILAIVMLAGGLATLVSWGQKLMATITKIGSFSNRLGMVIASVVAVVVGGVIALLGLPAEASAALIVMATLAIAGIAKVVVDNWGSIARFFGGVWKQAVGFFSWALTAITVQVTGFTPAQIVKAWSGLSDFFGGLWTRAKASFLSGVASLWSALPPWLQTILKGAAIVAQISLGLPVLPSLPLPKGAKPPVDMTLPPRPAPRPYPIPKPGGPKPPVAIAKPAAAKAAALARPAAAVRAATAILRSAPVARPAGILRPAPIARAAAIARPAAAPARAVVLVRVANDQRPAPAALSRALGPARSLSASGPPASIRREAAAAPAQTVKAEVAGKIEIHVTADHQVEVRHVESSPGFQIDVKRGVAA